MSRKILVDAYGSWIEGAISTLQSREADGVDIVLSGMPNELFPRLAERSDKIKPTVFLFDDTEEEKPLTLFKPGSGGNVLLEAAISPTRCSFSILGLVVPRSFRDSFLGALEAAREAYGINASLDSIVHLWLTSSKPVIYVYDCYPWLPTRRVSASTVERFDLSRGGDGFISTILLRPVSRRLSRAFIFLGVHPNAISLFSLLLMLLGGSLLLLHNGTYQIYGIFSLAISLVLDCCDGEVARASNSSTEFGAWLDGFTDRIKENGLLLAIAVSGMRSEGNLWFLFLLAVAAITARHLQAHDIRVDLNLVTDRSFFGGSLGALFERPGLRALDAKEWVSRILHAPVSERWFVLLLTYGIGGAKPALVLYTSFLLVSTVLVGYGHHKRKRRFSRLNTDSSRNGFWRNWHRLGPFLVEVSPLILIALIFQQAAPAVATLFLSWYTYEILFSKDDSRDVPTVLIFWSWRVLFWVLALVGPVVVDEVYVKAWLYFGAGTLGFLTVGSAATRGVFFYRASYGRQQLRRP